MSKKDIDNRGENSKYRSGTKRTTRYDRDGRKTGEALEQIDRAGLRTIEYYDRDGRKMGESRETNCCNGFNRIEHFDRDGRKTGEDHVEISD